MANDLAALSALADLQRAPYGVGGPNEPPPLSALGNIFSGAYQGLGNLARRVMGASEMMRTEGMYDPAPAVEAAMLPMGTGAVAGLKMAPGEMALGAGPIRAYHGSPSSFEKFDYSKIGTGEGAQSYGHGLYFAEHEPTAQYYRDALTAPVPTTNGRIVGRGDGKFDIVDDFGTQAGPFTTRAEAEQAMKGGGGHMYEVNINADPEHFMDWEKSLAQQPPQVQEALKTIIGKNWDEFKYAKAGDALRQGHIAYSPEAAADRLRQAGIPGIKYLDQGSRAAGEGSRNYVVFDDRMIDILKKYGIAGLLGTGAVTSQYGNRE